ncbi:MAG: hypothetical protein JOZ98_01030 [Solirubrobacterales bacterium]|nr:hypothetical protein [Solirubrobacterales bacterium]
MSTFQANLRTQPSFKVAVGKAVAGVGALLALEVTGVFLVLPGKGDGDHLARTHDSTPYPSLIQDHGTGAPPLPRGIAAPRVSSATPVSISVPDHPRAQHSYGAVP